MRSNAVGAEPGGDCRGPGSGWHRRRRRVPRPGRPARMRAWCWPRCPTPITAIRNRVIRSSDPIEPSSCGCQSAERRSGWFGYFATSTPGRPPRRAFRASSAFSVWPERYATTCPARSNPHRARSPIRSSTLCRAGSSAKRSRLSIGPRGPNTSISAIASGAGRRRSPSVARASDSVQNVRHRATSRANFSGVARRA